MSTHPPTGKTRVAIQTTALLAICFALSATASAQISLSSAVDLALRSEPRVKMAEAAVQKAEAAKREATSAYAPTVSMSGGYGKSTGAPVGLPTVFNLAGQSLVFNYSQRDNMRSAEAALQAAKLSLLEARDTVAEDVIVTYLDLDNAQQRQQAIDQELGFANRLVTIVQDRLNAGQDDRMSLLQAKRTAKQIELQQLQSSDEVLELSNHLARLIALPGNSLSTVHGSIPALPEVKTLALDSPDDATSFGIQSAIAIATSKKEFAFGEARYRFRPQISLVGNYSRLNTSTSQSDFLDYYPDFKGKPNNNASIALEMSIPLFDRAHQERAAEAMAEANRAHFEAMDQRNQFLDGRFKLRRTAVELSTRADLAAIDRDIAQQQLDTILIQLQPDAANPDKPQLTPKDEQNARLQERAKTIDLLAAQFQLTQAQINLLRQTGQLDAWLRTLATTPESAPTNIIPTPQPH